jgi:uncharacterized protein (TIGR02145 family)
MRHVIKILTEAIIVFTLLLALQISIYAQRSINDESAFDSIKEHVLSPMQRDYNDKRLQLSNARYSHYSNEINDTVTDIEGNHYPTVIIGNQEWMAKNLRTTHYADGTPIPGVSDNFAWDTLDKNDKAYCWYYNDSTSNAVAYGALYTWSAAMNGAASSNDNPSGVQGVCPDGWHLPGDDEWAELVNYVSNDGHSGSEAIALKSTSGWHDDGNGTDDYGFNALPGGRRYNEGDFSDFGCDNTWWSATEDSLTTAFGRVMYYSYNTVGQYKGSKDCGFSVRCLRDGGPEPDQIYGVYEQDSLALVALYNATNGYQWDNNTNWLAGNVSDWYGITVVNNRVIAIELVHNNLNGNLPPELSKLTKLEVLYLPGNCLIGNIPHEIGNLSCLIEFNLSMNQLVGIIPPQIGKLTHLQKLNLYGNRLTGRIPEEIGDLINLEELVLVRNELTDSLPSGLGNLVELRKIYLADNCITGHIPPNIGNLKSLEVFDVYDNHLSGSIPPEIGNLNLLKKLNLSKNRLTGGIPAEIGNLTNLQCLNISDNRLNGRIPSKLGEMSNLKELNLKNNQFSGLPDLSSLTSLFRCYVEKNHLDFKDLTAANISAKVYKYSPQAYIVPDSSEENDEITLMYTGGGIHNSYQWYNGDIELSGETDSILVVNNTEEGAYYCKATNKSFPGLTLQNIPVKIGNPGIKNGIITAEYKALEDFYNATDGDSWDNSGLWLSDTIAAVWPGLRVEGVHVTGFERNDLNGRVDNAISLLNPLDKLISLSLSWQSSTGKIPSEIGDFNHLERLYLNGKISDSLPPEIGKLGNLEELILRGNLQGSIPVETGSLSNLKWLDLSGNQLADSLPAELGNLNQLERLHLANNQFVGNIPVEFGNLTNLKHLTIGWNKLSGNLPSELGNMTNLEWLHLSGNKITGGLPPEIRNIKNLRGIYLDDNELTKLPELESFNNLNYLGVRDNHLTFEDIEPNIDVNMNWSYSPQKKVDSIRNYLINTGENFPLGVSVGGYFNTYQWYKDSTLIDGATDDSLMINNFNREDEGVYTCNIENSAVPELKLVSHPITLSSSGFYTVTFHITADGDPVEGAEINIHHQTLITGADGKDSLRLSNGSYSYTISAPGFNEFADSIKVTNEDVHRNVALQAIKYPLTYYVYYGCSYPIANAEIIVGEDTLSTNEQGFATLYLSNGTYSYHVHSKEYGNVVRKTRILNRANTVNVAFEIDYRVTFKVTDGSEPIEGAVVELEGDTLITDAEGEADIELGNGEYAYEVTAPDFKPIQGRITVSYGVVKEAVILRELNYLVTFTVTDGSNPLEGATINIDDSTFTTDANGNATVKLVNGSYDYTVTADGYEDVADSLKVSGAEVDEEVILIATNVDQVEPYAIKVYPNPVFTMVVIETSRADRVEMVNIEGKVVIEKEVKDAVTRLNISQINAGIYILHLYMDSGKRHTERLLVH